MSAMKLNSKTEWFQNAVPPFNVDKTPIFPIKFQSETTAIDGE